MEDRIKELVDENSKDELVELAEEYELDTSGNKPDIADRIARFEAGVPQKVEEEAKDEPVDEPVAEEPVEEPLVLVKMERLNASYTVGGVTFTQKNPYRVLPESRAFHLIENVDGFREANRREVENYYS